MIFFVKVLGGLLQNWEVKKNLVNEKLLVALNIVTQSQRFCTSKKQ